MLPRLREGGGESDGARGPAANVARYARTTFVVEMARVSPSFALSWGASTGLFGANVAGKGTPEQVERFALPVLRSERVGSWALTEPGAGSDALSGLRTTARRDGDHYVLNGSKTFITNAPVANVFVIYATVDKKLKHAGITAFIVERGFKGISTGNPFHKMGVRASATSEVFLEDCEVPEENLLGEAGKGFEYTHETLSWDRSALLAPFVGGMQFALDQCGQYATDRVQFDKPIKSFQAIQHKLADIKVVMEASRLLMYRVAWDKDAGLPLNHYHTSIAKTFVGDWGFKASSEAVQIFGGYGYIHEYPIEAMLRDAKLGQIGGGTSEINRFVISRLMSF
jgi:alkylation response protein AidB-like acyl-CoA dehydrogenase